MGQTDVGSLSYVQISGEKVGSTATACRACKIIATQVGFLLILGIIKCSMVPWLSSKVVKTEYIIRPVE